MSKIGNIVGAGVFALLATAIYWTTLGSLCLLKSFVWEFVVDYPRVAMVWALTFITMWGYIYQSKSFKQE